MKKKGYFSILLAEAGGKLVIDEWSIGNQWLISVIDK